MKTGNACMLTALLIVACLGCDRSAPVAFEADGPYHSVEIDLSPLHRALIGGVQQTCVSTATAAVLRVGGQRMLRKAIPAEALSVRFDSVEVDPGTVVFSADVESNNGTVLYSGEVTEEISGDGFRVTIPLEKQAPVMVVCPGDIALNRATEFSEAVEVFNRGEGVLTYEAVSPDCNGEPCIVFEVGEGSIEPGESDLLFAFLSRMAPQPTLELRVASPADSLLIEVTLEEIPDLEVVSFEAGTPQVNQDEDVEVPVSVVVRNAGNVAADVFKLAAEYTGRNGGPFVTPFRLAGQEEGFYAFTEVPLEPGGEVTLEGTVFFFFAREQPVQLHIEVDSCSGEEFVPPYCRIDEFNEFNNLSVDETVSLP